MVEPPVVLVVLGAAPHGPTSSSHIVVDKVLTMMMPVVPLVLVRRGVHGQVGGEHQQKQQTQNNSGTV
jgi:hypothetical protein